jgi:anti-anti-sigma factor
MTVPDGEGQFDITETADGDSVRLTLSGELDLASAEQLRARLQVLADAATTVSLDLSELRFIDSSGLGILVMFHQYAARESWNLSINPRTNGDVARIIRLAGLDSLFWQ